MSRRLFGGWGLAFVLLARGAAAQGVDVDRPEADGMTALHWAVYHDDLDAARRLV
jgi:hypothetical protein